MQPIKSRLALETGLRAIARKDARLKDLWRRAGTPGLRRRKSGFPGLLRVIVGQQLSVAAASTIWSRLVAAVEPLTPEAFLDLSPERLREIGFSRQKLAFGRELAAAATDGRVNFARLARLEDAEAIERLTAITGIGRWTAECYLLFVHGRPDIWPAQDLALAAAYQRLLRLDERPQPNELDALARAWSPWRSVAARLLWHGYGKAVL
jgi:DNA-3-methyladenine glycosylase II